jgi:hypothetical protein
MRSRMLAAGLLMLAGSIPVDAQVSRNFSAFDVPFRPSSECDSPATLPPLLPVPPATVPPSSGPGGPKGEYDPGYFYLPERAPERSGPGPCGPGGRVWLGAGLELAWLKPAQVPALVRLGSLTGPVAYGGKQASPLTAGLSLGGGFWLNEERTAGFDASLFLLPQAGTNSAFFSNSSTLLLPTPVGPFPLADPTRDYAGAFQAGFNTRFTSADVNYRNNILCSPDARLDALIGYRFAHIGDEGAIYGKRLGPGGEIVRFRDDITAINNFHGGQIGLSGEYRMDRWYVSGTGKVAFGAVFTDTDLEGKFRVNGTVVPLGFYARPGVNGPRDHSSFAVMPVVGLTLGRQLSDHARIYLGYNFLYLNSLTRAPDVVDPTPTVLAANPQGPLAAATVRRDATTSDFWVQSLSLGMEWRY